MNKDTKNIIRNTIIISLMLFSTVLMTRQNTQITYKFFMDATKVDCHKMNGIPCIGTVLQGRTQRDLLE